MTPGLQRGAGRGQGKGRGQGQGRGQGRGQGQGIGKRLQRHDGSGCDQPTTLTSRPDSASATTTDADTAGAPERRARPVAGVADPEACVLCGACLDACVRGAISLDETVVIDARLCTGCGDCIDTCPQDVLELAEV